MSAQRLVLAGGGHTHAQVLLDWLHAPLPGVELVLVTPQAAAPYSGMVPGWLAGCYRDEEIAIDFAALCAACGARWVADEVAALDPDARRLTLASGETLAFDRLSLNVGSTLTVPMAGVATVMPLRPLVALRERWARWLQTWAAAAAGAPASVLAVGGGAAGVESLLAVIARLRVLRPDRPLQAQLVTAAPRLLDGFAPGAVRAAERALSRAGVAVHTGTEWSPGAETDLLLWATGAEAQAWQRDPATRGTLAVGARGFVRVDTQLRSVSHPSIHAAGDCAEWAEPLPKSGVYAVRMGPVLSRNLRAAFGSGTAAAYVPQRRVLALLATADGRAIAARGGLAAEGRWVWRWKDAIDRRFIARYRVAAPKRAVPGAAAGDPP